MNTFTKCPGNRVRYTKKEREGIVQWDDNGELTIVLDCGRYSVDPPELPDPSSRGSAKMVPLSLNRRCRIKAR